MPTEIQNLFSVTNGSTSSSSGVSPPPGVGMPPGAIGSGSSVGPQVSSGGFLNSWAVFLANFNIDFFVIIW